MKVLIALLLAKLLLLISLPAAVETYGPKEILYEIELRFVVTETTGGARAQDLGNSTQRDYIKSQMDKILAQFGASVKFPSSDDTWVSDYAYEGSPSDTGSRTTSDLSWIFNNIPTSYYQPDQGVITVVFCERTPGFGYNGNYYTNGYAYIGGNGVTFYLGAGMLQNNGNMDIVAAVLAHEIGHNLDLRHVSDTDNLMHSTIYEGYLESNQTDTILDERFSHGFLAQFGAPELEMTRSGNNLSFKYLRSTDGVEQFTSSTVLQAIDWNNETSTLDEGVYETGTFSITSAPQRFFRVETPSTAAASTAAPSSLLKVPPARALPPVNHESIGCSSAEL
ncbi:MAG: zinc-dependent metalloprotease family protein [Opitutaceae bacterium]